MPEGTEIAVVRRCIAQTKKGNVCGAPTIDETLPYCYNHMKNVGTPTGQQHQRYMQHMPESVREDFAWQMEDDNPKDLMQELAMSRVILNKIWQRIEATDGQVVTDKDIQMMLAIKELIRRIADTQARINPDKVVTIADAMKAITEIIEIIRKTIPSEMVQLREKIVSEIQRFVVAELTSKSTDLTYGSKPDEPKEQTIT